MKTRTALAVLVLAARALSSPVAAQAEKPHVNMVVVYDKEGGFIVPESVLELIVYDNGSAVLSRRDGLVPTGKVCTTSARAARVAALQDQLAAAGAFFLPSNPLSVPPDTAGVTLTFFVPRPASGRARANTFTYGAQASAPYLQADQAVQSFIADLFPDC